MSKAIITEQLLTDIADELRDKYETSDTYTPAQMADAVSGLTKVSGSIAINVSGTIDVRKYESADVPSGVEGVPTATKGAVSNHSVSVTPAVTNEAGMIVGGTHTGTPVTVSASELVSGSETKTANGTYDVTNLSEVVVDVPTPPSVTVEPLSVTDNGTYTAPSGTAYSPVTVNVSGVGGITADDIAMRTISGAITGSSASWISANAFQYCSSLTEVSFPVCTTIRAYAFAYCFSLTDVSFPACTSMGSYAFQNCSSLTEVSFPVCTSIGASAFYQCSSLTDVSFPACTSIGTYAFDACRSLTEVSFPACTSIGANAFQNCYSLTEVSFPACITIGNNAFRYCYNLLSFNLVGVSSVPTLGGAYAFLSTPIGGYTRSTGGVYGSVYVPASLYSAFISAVRWSSISSRIVSVE